MIFLLSDKKIVGKLLQNGFIYITISVAIFS